MAKVKLDSLIKGKLKPHLVSKDDLTSEQLNALEAYKLYKLGEEVFTAQSILEREKYEEEHKDEIEELRRKELSEEEEKNKKVESELNAMKERKSSYIKKIMEWYKDNMEKIEILIEKYLTEALPSGSKYVPTLQYDEFGSVMLQIQFEIPRGRGRLQRCEMFTQNIVFYPLTENEDIETAYNKIFSDFEKEFIVLLEDAEKFFRRKS